MPRKQRAINAKTLIVYFAVNWFISEEIYKDYYKHQKTFETGKAGAKERFPLTPKQIKLPAV